MTPPQDKGMPMSHFRTSTYDDLDTGEVVIAHFYVSRHGLDELATRAAATKGLTRKSGPVRVKVYRK
jgi:hypothetical protein